jgi:hypothetical protein
MELPSRVERLTLRPPSDRLQQWSIAPLHGSQIARRYLCSFIYFREQCGALVFIHKAIGESQIGIR